MSLKICARSLTKALMPLLSALLAVFLMVVAHFLEMLFELVVSSVISI